MRARSRASADRLRALAAGFPEDLLGGWALGHRLDPPPPGPLAIVGVGGSGIAGDLLASLLRTPGAAPVLTLRSVDGNPAALPARATVAFVSYSGGTRETLAAYDTLAGRSGARVTVGSGGELERRARRDGVPHVRIPTGRPPRAALGWLLGALLGWADDRGGEGRGQLEAAARRLKLVQPEWRRADGPPARVAERVGRRQPIVLANAELGAVARRWANQIEENAKRLATVSLWPECLHNELVAWEVLPTSRASGLAALMIETGPAAPRSATDYLERVWDRRGLLSERIRFEEEDLLTTTLAAVSFGDHLAVSMAERAGVDPVPVPAIDRWKRWSEDGPAPRRP